MSPAKPYVSGTGSAPPASKKSVAQTCNQLSLFLKDKQQQQQQQQGGCLKDLHFGINSKFDDSAVKSTPTTNKTTMDLLSNMDGQNTSSPGGRRPVAAAAASSNNNNNKTINSQMTIFYNGQVMVVDDMSQDRAKEVMLLAAASATNNTSSSKAKAAAASSSQHYYNYLGSNQQQRTIDVVANGLDLPIARRASLHKFLAKRKDRATVRPDPYQLPNPSGSHKNNEHKLFDLNL